MTYFYFLAVLRRLIAMPIRARLTDDDRYATSETIPAS